MDSSGGEAEPPTPGIDPGNVATWLSTLGVEPAPPIRLTRLGDGKSNLTYLVRDRDDRRWVLRRPPLGPLLPSAHDVAREHRILAALAPTQVPVARPLGLSLDPAVCDAPLLLMEFVEGLVIDSVAVAETVSLVRRHAVGLSLAAVLGQVHAVDLEATGLLDLASHKPYADRQIRRWRQQWDATGLRENPVVHTLADRFSRAAPVQSELTLVHGDYHLLNVSTDPVDGSVNVIFDWELCTLGAPIADLGGLLAYWPEPSDAELPGPARLSRLPGFPSRAELVSSYAAATGRDVSDVGFWHALATWKVAIIAEGVRARVLREPQNAAGETFSVEAIDALLDRAGELADEAGLPA